MIALIDYGLGNVRAFQNVYKRLNIPIMTAQCKKDLYGASKLILPGVGAFDSAIKQFHESGMMDEVTRMVFYNDVPILGICVGMQMLASSSDEGVLPGLGWIKGSVKKFNEQQNKTIQLPHMGWNDIKLINKNRLLTKLDMANFYFLHSYYFLCDHKEDVIAESDYGHSFACAVNNKHIYGVQFHPEKSHMNGVQLLKNFAELDEC